MGAAETTSRERALEAREAVRDPEQRRQLAEDLSRVSADAKGLLRLALPSNRLGGAAPRAADDSRDCGTWFQTAAACYALAAVTEDDDWRDTGDACVVAGEACEALQDTL